MGTTDRTNESPGARRLRLIVLWVAAPYVFGSILWDVIQGYAAGHGWLDILGLNKHLVLYLGDMGVPFLGTMVLLRTVRKLPPSRERTILTRVGWSAFVFLILWWGGLRLTVVFWPWT